MVHYARILIIFYAGGNRFCHNRRNREMLALRNGARLKRSPVRGIACGWR